MEASPAGWHYRRSCSEEGISEGYSVSSSRQAPAEGGRGASKVCRPEGLRYSAGMFLKS